MPPQPLNRYQHAPLFLLITAFITLQPLSTDIYLASLPSLSKFFAVPPSTVQLTLSLFVIGFGAAQLIVGPLSDRFGRRPVVLGGLSLYALASLLCALAPSIHVLITGRFLQALGCCASVVVGRAIVRDAYAPEDSVRVVVKASTWLTIVPLLGPIIGSYMQVHLGWRAAFVVHTLLSLGLLYLSARRLPETNTYRDPDATNLRGLTRNFRIVLSSPLFWVYALPGALSYGAIFVFISSASFALIDILHLPTEYFGYCFSFGVFGYLVGITVCNRVHARLGSPRTSRIGTLVSLTGGVVFLGSVLLGQVHWLVIPLVMFITLAGHGFNSPMSVSNSVTPFPQQAGTAAGLTGVMTMIAAFIVTTLIGIANNGTLYPMAIASCVLGVLIFISSAWLQAHVRKL
jgi:MFS transporter, DHA1 family, multidrug resistance protein